MFETKTCCFFQENILDGHTIILIDIFLLLEINFHEYILKKSMVYTFEIVFTLVDNTSIDQCIQQKLALRVPLSFHVI